MISGFFGENRWLSNFWYAKFTLGEYEYDTVEHYYQSLKSDDPEEAAIIRAVSTPAEAKRLGGQVKHLNARFMTTRRSIMNAGVEAKYQQNPELMQKLLDTGEQYIQETNTWGDTFWGVCNGKGSNHMGHITMAVRDHERNSRLWDMFL